MRAPGTKATARHLWRAYRLRWKRRYFLWRAFRRRTQLTAVSDRTGEIDPRDILLFSTVRNEAERLPHFLEFYRRAGIQHFLIVDNDSQDETQDLLRRQPDVSLWTTPSSYKAARFGVDWLTHLQFWHGHGHWCLTVDADELFIHPHHDQTSLRDLTDWLDTKGRKSFGATMLELFPKGPLGEAEYEAGDDPLELLRWFDPHGIEVIERAELGTVLLRGGVRRRMFFDDRPERAPTLSKVPLVRWSRRYTYLTSTHVILPPSLNRVFSQQDPDLASGAILHTKFLPSVVRRSAEEKYRAEHFSNSTLYDRYYDALAAGPTLWNEHSLKYEGWRQLADLGLMNEGDFRP